MSLLEADVQATSPMPDDYRLAEYRLFGQVTKALTDARARFGDTPARDKALNWNREMWAALQEDLLRDDNQLPETLRAQIISVAIWVDRHTGLVFSGKARIDPLIDINRTIMDGLIAVNEGARSAA